MITYDRLKLLSGLSDAAFVRVPGLNLVAVNPIHYQTVVDAVAGQAPYLKWLERGLHMSWTALNSNNNASKVVISESPFTSGLTAWQGLAEESEYMVSMFGANWDVIDNYLAPISTPVPGGTSGGGYTLYGERYGGYTGLATDVTISNPFSYSYNQLLDRPFGADMRWQVPAGVFLKHPPQPFVSAGGTHRFFAAPTMVWPGRDLINFLTGEAVSPAAWPLVVGPALCTRGELILLHPSAGQVSVADAVANSVLRCGYIGATLAALAQYLQSTSGTYVHPNRAAMISDMLSRPEDSLGLVWTDRIFDPCKVSPTFNRTDATKLGISAAGLNSINSVMFTAEPIGAPGNATMAVVPIDSALPASITITLAAVADVFTGLGLPQGGTLSGVVAYITALRAAGRTVVLANQGATPPNERSAEVYDTWLAATAAATQEGGSAIKPLTATGLGDALALGLIGRHANGKLRGGELAKAVFTPGFMDLEL